MPLNRVPDFQSYLFDLLENTRSTTRVQPTYLGSASNPPPGGFIGSLSQRYVAYDVDELETLSTGSVPSLLDNLNHIRYRISHSVGGGGSVSGSGSAGTVAYWSSGSVLASDLGFSYNATRNRLIIGVGGVTPSGFSTYGGLMLLGQTSVADGITHANTDSIGASDSATGGTYNTIWRSRGTLASPTALQNGDFIGSYGFGGYTGSTWGSRARIEAYSSTDWSSGSQSTRISVRTTSGSVSRETVRFSSDGEMYNETSGSEYPYWHSGNTGELTKDPTGFSDPGNIVETYDPVMRTITLTGNVAAYWRGKQVAGVGSGWTSGSHAAANGVYYLSYDGSAFNWSASPWTLDKLQIAYVNYSGSSASANTFAIRECHGFMPWQAHEEFHETIGCYRESGGTLGGYTLLSTTAAQRRPTVSACILHDEDCITTNGSATAGSYTQMYLSGSAAAATFVTAAADIVPLLTANPYYNQWDGAQWKQTLMANNSYMSIWLLAIPATASAQSQQYRFVWVQGQSNGNLAGQQSLTPASLNLSSFTTLASEFVFLAQVIIRYAGGDWDLYSVSNITGNRYNQTAAPAGVWLSSVSATYPIQGTGVSGDPLTLAAATAGSAGSMSATDKTKLDQFNPAAGVTLSVTASGSTAIASGIANGQTIYGGTGANDDLTLEGTSHATKTTSYVLLQPNGGNVGLGALAPLTNLDIRGTSPALVDYYGLLVINSTDAMAINKGGGIGFGGAYTGTTITQWASIHGRKENATDNDYSGCIQFWTRLNGNSIAERGRFSAGGNFGINEKNPSNLLCVTDGGTSAGIATIVKFTATRSGAAGDGGAIVTEGKSSTTSAQTMTKDEWLWATATHATRAARRVLSVYDTAARECLRLEANGSAAMLGFFGVNAVVRPTALTTQLTSITHSAPGTPDYALQDLVQNTGFGFVTKDEGNTVLSVILNLQTRVSELETKLKALGLLT